MNCDRFAALVDDYLNERLDGATREAWREHLCRCPACRAAAVRTEPTLAFAALGPREIPAAEVDRCVAAVEGLIHRERLVHRLHRRTRRWLAAAAAGLVLAAGGLVWRLHGGAAPTVAARTAPAALHVATPPPEVEVAMPGSEIRVYQFAGGGDDLAVTYIVNPAMEL